VTPIAEPCDDGLTTSRAPISRRARAAAACAIAPRYGDSPGDGKARPLEQDCARRRLCIASALAEDIRPDVGQIEHFQQSLDGAILADVAVNDREDDVVPARAKRLREECVELESHHAMPGLHEGPSDPGRGRAAHFGLRGRTALDDGDGRLLDTRGSPWLLGGGPLTAADCRPTSSWAAWPDMSTSSMPSCSLKSKILGSR
jgi:hypothetical protein